MVVWAGGCKVMGGLRGRLYGKTHHALHAVAQPDGHREIREEAVELGVVRLGVRDLVPCVEVDDPWVVGGLPRLHDDLRELVDVGGDIATDVEHLALGVFHQAADGDWVCDVVDVAANWGVCSRV